jgi:hypothetical protein
MHIATGPTRVDLGINQLPDNVKAYICALETELERTQARQHRLRQNIRSMQVKCRTYNLLEALGQATSKESRDLGVGIAKVGKLTETMKQAQAEGQNQAEEDCEICHWTIAV